MTQRTTRSRGSQPAVDSTEFTLAYLRVLRRGQHRADTRQSLYVLYCVTVIGAIWAVPYLAAAAVAAQEQSLHGPVADRALAGLPPVLAVLLAGILLISARAACWRGPVLLGEPAVGWLVPQPVSRAKLLLPALRRTALITGAGGAVLGALAGFALQAVTSTPWWATTAAGLWCGGTTALGCTALRALVQRHQEHLTRAGAREFLVLRGGVVLLAVLAGCAAAWELTALGWLLLWAGPWGWPGLPLAAASGLLQDGLPVWVAIAGVLLSGGCLALLGWYAYRATPAVPARVLRLQSRLAFQLTAALYAFDLGGARHLTHGVYQRRTRRVWRPPPPGTRWLLVPWRDLLALLRAPGRFGSALLWAVAGVLAWRLAREWTGELGVLATLLALAASYRAATRAALGAELTGTDPRRSGPLPWTHAQLASRHAVLPTVVLVVGILVGAGGCAVIGHGHPATLALLAAVPSCVAAALVSAYRGSMPAHQLIGTETGFGNTAALNVTLWHSRGPLTLLSLTAPVYLLPLAWPLVLGWLGVTALGLLWWARKRAGAPSRTR